MTRHMTLARAVLVVVLLMLGTAPSALHADSALPADRAHSGQLPANQFIMQYRPGAAFQEIENDIRGRGGSILQHIPQLNAVVVQLPGKGPLYTQRTREAAQGGLFTYVEPNRMRYPMIDPNDPYYYPTGATPLQWGLERIHAPAAWDVAQGSGIVIAVLDTGVDLDHPDLLANLLPGYDVVSNDNQPQDSGLVGGHGTHVAGIANAITDNEIGIAGVAWNASTLPVRVIDLDGAATSANIAAGIVWATDHGANVINLSLGGLGWQKLERDAVNYAASRGVVVVSAAGNDGTAYNYYPASYDHVISVASTRQDDVAAYYSNISEYLDIAAPGGANTIPSSNIWSTVDGGGYGYKAGTSMATPHVAGVAALVWSAGHATTAQEVTQAVLCSALDKGAAGYDMSYGYGLLQADAAVNYDPGAETSCLPAVPHDDFSAAREVDSLAYTDTVTTTFATSWTDDPEFCAGSGSRTVWYRFTAPESGVLTVSTAGSTYDTVLGIFTGERGALQPQACGNDNAGGGVSEQLTVTVFHGDTVTIGVTAFGHEDNPPYTAYRGTLTLNATFALFPLPGCRPAGDGAVLCTTE